MSLSIVGRAQTSQLLLRHVEAWKNGKGSVVFLTGEPGSGKSYVLDALELELGEHAVRVDCKQPIGSFNVASIQPLQPFGLAIERLYQNGEQVARKRLALNVGMSLLASLPIAGDIFYAIKAVKQDVSEYKRETAALSHKRKAAVQECVAALKSVATEQPLALLVDAAHWSDPQSIEVLRRLSADKESPILVVWSFDPRLARVHNPPLMSLQAEVTNTTVTIVLEGVSESEAKEILSSIAPTIKATDEQITILQQRSGGLPGVLVEYVKYLQHTGEIQADGTIRTDGILTSGVQLGSHPSTDILLHEVQEDDALLLSICAAEGRECTAFLVAALTNTDVITAVRTLRRLEHKTGTLKSIGVRTCYGVKTTVYKFTSDLAYTYFLHYASYEERKHVHQRIIEILSKEHDASDLEAMRTQLAAVIAAHGIIAEDNEVTQRMLGEVDADLVRGLPLASIGIELPTADITTPEPNTPQPADINQLIRNACAMLIEGKSSNVREMTQYALQQSSLTVMQHVTLLCIEARACIATSLTDEAERLLLIAEGLATNTNNAKALVMNMLAVLAYHRGNVTLASTLVTDALHMSNSISSDMHILTASNTLLFDQQQSQPTSAVKRALATALKKRQWSNLAKDLGLALITGFMLLVHTVSLYAGTNDVEARRRSIERAHPTPNPDALKYKHVPKVPFVQEEVRFPSQFLNADMIADEQDQQPMQNESSIAVNPTNPSNLIGSAVDYRGASQTWAYFSTDGGNVWKNVKLGYPHPSWKSTNDPSVCFDHLGRGYLCYGGFNVGSTPQFGENGVFVSITNNGGETWGPTHVAVIEHLGTQTADSAFEDKYYIHADTASSSAFRGNLYIPWKRVINSDSSTQIVISRSTDRGLTWSAPVPVSNRYPHTSEHATFGQSFPLARTGPDGSLHVVWNSGTENAVRYARSTDGGLTFSEPRILHTYKPFGEKLEVEGTVNSRVKGVVRAEAYPSLAINNTGKQNNGHLYLVWAADNPPNVYCSVSTDNGSNWSAPKVVHSDTANDQFWSWIAIDPTNGDIAVMYFDSRDDEQNILVNCYVSYSNNDGKTWTDRRVGDSENDLRNNPFTGRVFAGDYSGCDFYNGIVYPSWVDMRHTTTTNTANSDVYTAIVNTRAPQAPAMMAAHTIADAPTSIDVQWSAATALAFGQPIPPNAQYLLYRDGVLIQSLPLGTTQYHDNGLDAYREYTYSLTVATTTDTSATRSASAFAGGWKLPAGPALVQSRGKDSISLPFVALDVTMPKVRLDGVTPLVNLSSLHAIIGSDTLRFALNKTDTGRTIHFEVPIKADGWHQVTVGVSDDNGNNSPLSDTAVVFAGSMLWQQETFDSLPNYWVQKGEWGLGAFAYSAPSSFTESPAGEYGRTQRDTVLLYPHRTEAWIPENNALVLSWRVAAFIDPSDTAFLEVKRYGANPHDWQTIEWWNSSIEPRWTDTTKGVDAWRFGKYVFDLSTDTLQLRLRFRSNLTKHSDGLYIDDITWETATSVQEVTSLATSVFPQPATSTLLVELANASDVTNCIVTSIEGAHTLAPWHQQNHTLVLDVSNLPNGVFAARIATEHGVMHTTFVVFR